MTMTDHEPTTPPHDLYAEQAVLGAMMLSPEVADEVTEVLGDDGRADFYRPIHQTIFGAITRLIGAGHKAEPIAVHDALGDDASRVGGVLYLHELTEKPPTALSGTYYAKIVAEKAARRRYVEAGGAITRAAHSPEPIADITDRVAQIAFDATTDRRVTPEIHHIGDLMLPAIEHMRALAEGTVEPGLPTGLADVDRLTGGMHAGELWIPAGRTSMGKSVATQNWVLNGVRHSSRPGLLFSVEMPKDVMMKRLIAEIAQVSLTRITAGTLTTNEWDRIKDAVDEIAAIPLHIVDNVRTVPGIRAASRRFAHRHGDLAIVGVDYLQRLTGIDRRRERHEEVGAFADGLKDLALDMKVPVIAPCQLNRGPENRTGKDANRPKLSDLRESGNLEQTADVVALLFRPEYYDRSSPRRGEADIDIAKNRNGPTDVCTVAARMDMQLFCDPPY